MNFFSRASSRSISILNPLILCESPSAAATTGALATGELVGTAGGTKSLVVGGAIDEAVGTRGGNGGVEIVGGATLGGITVVGLAVGGPTAGIFGGVGIGEDGFEGGVPILGGPELGSFGIDGIAELVALGGPLLGGAGGSVLPGTGGADAGIPGVGLGGGGGALVDELGITSPRMRSLLCSKLSAKDWYS